MNRRYLLPLFRRSLFAWLAVFVPLFGGATHIVGAEIYYTYQGNNNYTIHLIVYRDCGPTNSNGTGFDAGAPVAVYNATGTLVANLSLDLFDAEVDYVPVTLENPCFILPPDICIESASYEGTVNLPFNTGGYTLVYQRCCFNSSVSNLDFADDTGVTATTTIPGTALVDAQNTSAVFNNPTAAAMCLNAEFFYDCSATDADGDSLAYGFCTPYNGASPDDPAPNPPDAPPFDPVNWANGYSDGYPIASNPAFSIDPLTGLMTGTATQLGQYLVAICVDEYRDGVLISTHSRVFQFRVTLCDPNIIASIPEQTDFCDGLTIQFENESINAAFYHWDFGVEGTLADTSNLDSPTFTYPDSGVYTITLIANPGWPCADTAYTTYSALPVIQPVIVPLGFECVNDQGLYSFTADATTSAFAQYTWNFGVGSTPQTSTEWSPQDIELNPEDAEHVVSLTISDNGCTESTQATLENPPEPVAVIVDQQTFCDGLDYTFQNASLNATEYWWEFNTPINGDYSDDAAPFFSFPDTGQYVIMHVASAPFTCPDTAWMNFEIYGDLDPFFEGPDPQCLSTNAFDFTAQGASTGEATYSWAFGNLATPSSSASPAPQNIQFSEADTYTVVLTISENGCTESYTDSVWVAMDPTLDITLQNTEGCPDLYVGFDAESEAETQVFYDWDFGDGGSSSQENPTHIYTQTGTYTVTVTAATYNGCIATLTQQFPGAVHVYPVPVAGFVVEPSTVNILDPVVTVIDSSQNAVDWIYIMSDGGVVNEASFDYAWTEAGRMSIIQYVTNDVGCMASVTGYVNVEGFLFYAPNAFTPNNDGINDFWLPEWVGITKYHIRIFDRWGEVIFESTDPTEPWFGNVHGGEHFARDGAYVYQVSMEDLLAYPHEFSGHIILTR